MRKPIAQLYVTLILLSGVVSGFLVVVAWLAVPVPLIYVLARLHAPIDALLPIALVSWFGAVFAMFSIGVSIAGRIMAYAENAVIERIKRYKLLPLR